MGLHIISCIVTARTSRPNVSRRCFERLVSVLSRTGGNDVSVSSWSRHHTCHLQPCFVGLRAIAVRPIDFIQQSKAMAEHVKMEVDFRVEHVLNLY